MSIYAVLLFWHILRAFAILCKKGEFSMNSNIALIALLLLLTNNSSISTTQLLLILALLSTEHCNPHGFLLANNPTIGVQPRTTTTTCTTRNS